MLDVGSSGLVGGLSYTNGLVLLLGVPALLLIYIYSNRISREIITSIGRPSECKSAVAFPSRDPFFGIDMLYRLFKSAKQKTFLTDIDARFEEVAPSCNTYSSIFLVSRVIW